MHKKICYAIQYVVKNTPYNSRNIFNIRIHKKQTSGFWSMTVGFGAENRRFCEHLISISRDIGRFYGEELNITTELDVNHKPYRIEIN